MRRNVHVLALCSVVLSACIGAIGDGGQPTQGSTIGDPGLAKACSATYAPGHVSIHRLTNDEYSNTVRDLLFTKTRPGDHFDPTPAGLSGFENDSDALTISDDLVASYYTAADALAKEFLGTKSAPGGAYGQIVTCVPSTSCAQSTIQALATRAYRRPLTGAELTSLFTVYNNDTDFDTGIADVIITLLMNPKFLFVYVTNPQSQVAGATFAIDAYALASRLSYALWQSMPDDQLMQLAQSGQLTDPATLKGQVARMLKDPKVGSFLQSLRNDWAGLVAFAQPAGTVVGLDDATRMAMVGEVDAFLQDLVANDRSFLSVLTGTSGFLNQTLATYYGVPFSGSDPTQFVSTALPANRRGIVTSGAILTATAGDVAFTHPVHRGKWITQQITCTPPSPPPKGVPAVNFDPSQGGTPRQKLAAHVQPACAGCHTVMDTLGLGLENFDPYGKWRDAYPGNVGAVDPSGTLPDGKSFSTPFEMIDDLAADDNTRACLARQIMGYATTRAMTSADDHCVSLAIGTASVTPTGTFSDLLSQIFSSRQFLMQTGEAP